MNTKIQISFPLKGEIKTIDDLFAFENDMVKGIQDYDKDARVVRFEFENLPYIKLEDAQKAIRKYITNGRAEEALSQFESMWGKFYGGSDPDMGFVYDLIKRYQRSEEDELDEEIGRD